MVRPTVLLTDTIHPAMRPVLAEHCDVVVAPDASAATLASLIGTADGLIVRNKLPDDLFDHAPRLRAVVRHGVGLDLIPVAAATARGIAVANLPGSNTTAVAEYCIARDAAAAAQPRAARRATCAPTAGPPPARSPTPAPNCAAARSASSASARSARASPRSRPRSAWTCSA
jgi:D-3-phosphoglycerate dehydrogenase